MQTWMNLFLSQGLKIDQKIKVLWLCYNFAKWSYTTKKPFNWIITSSFNPSIHHSNLIKIAYTFNRSIFHRSPSDEASATS